jgi:hypothetical protein
MHDPLVIGDMSGGCRALAGTIVTRCSSIRVQARTRFIEPAPMRLGIALLLVTLFTGRASGNQAPVWSDAELGRFADAIVIGTVADVRAEWDRRIDAVYTFVTLEVGRTVKGATAGSVTLKQLGGTRDGVALNVPGQATFAVGERVLVFLETRPRDHTLYTVGLWQGKWRLTSDAIGGVSLAIRDRPSEPGWGVFGPARDVRLLDAWVRALEADRERTTRPDVIHPLASTSPTRPAPSMPEVENLPTARAARSDVATVPLRFLTDGSETSRAWNAAVRRAALQWNSALAQPTIIDDGFAAGRCPISFESSGATVVGLASQCRELASGGSTPAVSGTYVVSEDGPAAANRFVAANDSVVGAIAPRCLEQIAAHEIGHSVGLEDRSAHGDVMAPVVDRSCANPPRIFASLSSRLIGDHDPVQRHAASSAQAIGVPSAPRNLSASVSGSTMC